MALNGFPNTGDFSEARNCTRTREDGRAGSQDRRVFYECRVRMFSVWSEPNNFQAAGFQGRTVDFMLRQCSGQVGRTQVC